MVTVGCGDDIYGALVSRRLLLSPSVTQFAEAGGSSGFTATLDAAPTRKLSVPLEFSGAAMVGTDFSTSTQRLEFDANTYQASVTLTALDDALVEGDETFAVTLVLPEKLEISGSVTRVYTVLDDDSTPPPALALTEAVTLDADQDGRLDHYRLTFDGALDDATFPGFVADAIGLPQNEWLVQGHVDVALAHGAAAPDVDTPNDAVLYLAFGEAFAMDTGALPDLTTNTTLSLRSRLGGSLQPVTSETTQEQDGAAPLLLAATSETGSSALFISFSEPVHGGGICPDELLSAAVVNYHDLGNAGVRALLAGADMNGCDALLNLEAASGLRFSDQDLHLDTVSGNPLLLFDLAGNPTIDREVLVSGIVHPYLWSVVPMDSTHLRVYFSEPMQADLAADATQYSFSSDTCDGDPTLADGVAIDAQTFEFVTSPLEDCYYTVVVTGDLRDLDENATLLEPKHANFLGQVGLHLVRATSMNARQVLLSFSQAVAQSGPHGADNLGLYALPEDLGAVTTATRMDQQTAKPNDAMQVLLTHTLDQEGRLYLVTVGSALQNAVGSQTLAEAPLERAVFLGSGPQVATVAQGPLGVDLFGDDDSPRFAATQQGKLILGPNVASDAAVRLDADGTHPTRLTFRNHSAKVGSPFPSFGASTMRPATRVETPAALTTRYWLTPGTDLRAFATGGMLLTSGCSAVANNQANALPLVTLDDLNDWVEVATAGTASSAESCLVTLFNHAGPNDLDGLASLTAFSWGPQEGLAFGGLSITGNLSELSYSFNTDALLSSRYCDLGAVVLGAAGALQTIYSDGSTLYVGLANSGGNRPLFATMSLDDGGGGACPALTDRLLNSDKRFRNLPYLGSNPGNATANPATVVGIDSLLVLPDETLTPTLYVANNGGIAATTQVPPDGSAVWSDVKHNAGITDDPNPESVWSATTLALSQANATSPGARGIPFMIVWGPRLFVARNRTDGSAELWRYDYLPGLLAASSAARWQKIFNSTELAPHAHAIALLQVASGRLLVGFDNNVDGAELWQSNAGLDGLTVGMASDFERVGDAGLGPSTASATARAYRRTILAHAITSLGDRDALYLLVGCVSDRTDNGPCDTNPQLGRSRFAPALFRQVVAP